MPEGQRACLSISRRGLQNACVFAQALGWTLRRTGTRCSMYHCGKGGDRAGGHSNVQRGSCRDDVAAGVEGITLRKWLCKCVWPVLQHCRSCFSCKLCCCMWQTHYAPDPHTGPDCRTRAVSQVWSKLQPAAMPVKVVVGHAVAAGMLPICIVGTAIDSVRFWGRAPAAQYLMLVSRLLYCAVALRARPVLVSCQSLHAWYVPCLTVEMLVVPAGPNCRVCLYRTEQGSGAEHAVMWWPGGLVTCSS